MTKKIKKNFKKYIPSKFNQLNEDVRYCNKCGNKTFTFLKDGSAKCYGCGLTIPAYIFANRITD